MYKHKSLYIYGEEDCIVQSIPKLIQGSHSSNKSDKTMNKNTVWVLGAKSEQMDKLEQVLIGLEEYVEYARSSYDERCTADSKLSAHCENIRGCSYNAVQVECSVDILDGHSYEGVDYAGPVTSMTIQKAFNILGVCPECLGKGFATGNGGDSGYEGACHAGPYIGVWDWTSETVSKEILDKKLREWQVMADDLYENEGANTYGKEDLEREIAAIRHYLKNR